MKYWEIIAAKLSALRLSWGCSSETDANGRVLYTADAFSKDGKRFTALAADKLTAFLELERQVQSLVVGQFAQRPSLKIDGR